MKNYFIRAIVSAVAYTIVYLLRDLIFGKVHSFFEYVVQAVIFGILFGLFSYFCLVCLVIWMIKVGIRGRR